MLEQIEAQLALTQILVSHPGFRRVFKGRRHHDLLRFTEHIIKAVPTTDRVNMIKRSRALNSRFKMTPIRSSIREQVVGGITAYEASVTTFNFDCRNYSAMVEALAMIFEGRTVSDIERKSR